MAMMDYVPTHSWAGNQFSMQASVMAHNLTRELQMMALPRNRDDRPKRPAC